MLGFGDTFLGDILSPGEKHLHVIATKPYERDDRELVVVVVVFSYNGHSNGEDETCILLSTDGHPFIRHPSYVRYQSCKEFPVRYLEQLLGKTIVKKDTFAEKIRIKILQGMAKSEDTPNRYAIRALEQLDEMDLPE